ncbi:DUF115 domain-containing protein [Alteromonas sp. 1_MG-2023]|uniref:motility associated factor glycosyltransferase family protein n=1 Tax=Alteromonas sp. 1_MG-2023 TaxID=3062669 RepID=UPI0026E3BACD|nr:6-hydroxymethylpterin diphosphokinase MptE-like protein [Alteromonas sp. 1_MG-2023]MDO6568451.1 DUF115 domain-containing protein [Alteromonas sp. 1_MG-2023]
MLQQIQYHIHKDEAKQQKVEQDLAFTIKENYRLSIGALDRYIPSLTKLVRENESKISTLLCNKSGELNIVNYNSGQVLYGMHPEREIIEHFNDYLSKPSTLNFTNEVADPSSVIVNFGLGLGYHLEQIVLAGEYKHVVVYEPNVDYFVCSLSSINWQKLLKIAKQNDVALYLQIGSDGASFVSDMNELIANVGITRLSFYKHFHIPVFNELEEKLFSSNWKDMSDWVPRRKKQSLNESYLPIWAPLRNKSLLQSGYLDEQKKEKNLKTLQHYFPNLFEEYSDYTPKIWVPVADEKGEVSVYHKNTEALFSISPKQEAITSFSAFKNKPNKDGLLLSYTGKKLKSYLHYQLVEECESVIKGINEVQSTLPEKVKSLIMFGVASGYGIEALMDAHDVEMLFICEPNKDFFYASLYAIDWSQIIETFDEGKKRLYLNIGDDGSNLTNDLLVQFQSVGPYVLANTFFYQAYVNGKLTDAVAQLREQLLVIIAMGDYFDNAKYGISHTLWALNDKVPFLKKSVKNTLPIDVLDVPVFIVGNGPSLDNLMDTLKEESNKAIVISCGTAIQALHRHGICPDYHAEIETNRSTFDWLSRVDDDDYLRQITLLSCNGIHPDAASLFGQTLLAFKQGEASTVAFTELKKDHAFATLNFSYPTVTNFVADIVNVIGFSQVYLFGTDMGFVSDTYHHSKSSGYYDGKGKEVYDYGANHSMSLAIPGNFKPWVKTKYEFKVSKSVLEQVFAKNSSEVYNLNDGARILGANPLKQENVLLISTPEMKEHAKDVLETHAFTSKHNEWFLQGFATKYSTDSLIEELNALIDLVDTSFESFEDIDEFIAKQRDFIVSSLLRKKSLAFYYLNGTFNYINSMFSKLLNITDEQFGVDSANAMVKIWGQYVNDILSVITHDRNGFDAVSSLSGLRRQKVLGSRWKDAPLIVRFSSAQKSFVTPLMNLIEQPININNYHEVSINWLGESELPLSGSFTCNISKQININKGEPIKGLTVVSPGDYENCLHPMQANDLSRVDLSLIALVSELENVIFLQKYTQHPVMDVGFFQQFIELGKDRYCYGGPDFLVISDVPLSNEQLVLNSGDRLVFMPRLKAIDMRREFIGDEEYKERKGTVFSNLHCEKD